MATTAKAQPQTERTEHPHVVKTPGILGGEPRVEDTRISVLQIFGMVTGGMTIDEITTGWPSLSPAQIYDAVSYAYDHPDDMAHHRHRHKLRTIMKEDDMVMVNSVLYSRERLRPEDVPAGAIVYTWETLPKQEDE